MQDLTETAVPSPQSPSKEASPSLLWSPEPLKQSLNRASPSFLGTTQGASLGEVNVCDPQLVGSALEMLLLVGVGDGGINLKASGKLRTLGDGLKPQT